MREWLESPTEAINITADHQDATFLLLLIVLVLTKFNFSEEPWGQLTVANIWRSVKISGVGFTHTTQFSHLFGLINNYNNKYRS